MPTTTEILTKLRNGERYPLAAQKFLVADPVAVREEPAADAKGIKVQIKALGREPIDHWYFGKIIHDLSTCRMPRRMALDDSHGVEIGYCHPELTEYGIEAEGTVFADMGSSTEGGKRVADCLRNGIPQQASIDWSGPCDLVELPEGLETMVNGKVQQGPLCIVQNWMLRALAICKNGVDFTTEVAAQLNGNDTAKLAPAPRKISTISTKQETPQMNGTTTPSTATAPATPAAPATPVTPAPQTATVPATPTPPPQTASVPAAATPAPVAPISAPATTPAPAAEPVATAPGNDGAPTAPVASAPPQTAAVPSTEGTRPVEVTPTAPTATQTYTPPTAQQWADMQRELGELRQRLQIASTAGAPPVPNGNAQPSTQVASWPQAFAKIQAANPTWTWEQVHQQCSLQFPDLLAKEKARQPFKTA